MRAGSQVYPASRGSARSRFRPEVLRLGLSPRDLRIAACRQNRAGRFPCESANLGAGVGGCLGTVRLVLYCAVPWACGSFRRRRPGIGSTLKGKEGLGMSPPRSPGFPPGSKNVDQRFSPVVERCLGICGDSAPDPGHRPAQLNLKRGLQLALRAKGAQAAAASFFAKEQAA